MANRRNSSKKKSTKSNSASPETKARVALWVADETKNYASSGVIQLTKEHIEWLLEHFDDTAEDVKHMDDPIIKLRFFLYENDSDSEYAPDEGGNLAFDLLLND